MFFAGILIDFSKNEKIIYVLSVIYMSSNLIYMLFVFTGNRNMLTDGIDYMSFSYQALFSVLILIYYALKKKMLIYYAIVGVGCLYILMCGTRGYNNLYLGISADIFSDNNDTEYNNRKIDQIPAFICLCFCTGTEYKKHSKFSLSYISGETCLYPYFNVFAE